MDGLREELERAIPRHENAAPDVRGLLLSAQRARRRRRAVVACGGVGGLGVASVILVMSTAGSITTTGDRGTSLAHPATQQRVQGVGLYDVCAENSEPRLRVDRRDREHAWTITAFGFAGEGWKSTPGLDVVEGPDYVALRAACGNEEVWKLDFVPKSDRVTGGFFTVALPGTSFRAWVSEKAETPKCLGTCGP